MPERTERGGEKRKRYIEADGLEEGEICEKDELEEGEIQETLEIEIDCHSPERSGNENVLKMSVEELRIRRKNKQIRKCQRMRARRAKRYLDSKENLKEYSHSKRGTTEGDVEEVKGVRNRHTMKLRSQSLERFQWRHEIADPDGYRQSPSHPKTIRSRSVKPPSIPPRNRGDKSHLGRQKLKEDSQPDRAAFSEVPEFADTDETEGSDQEDDSMTDDSEEARRLAEEQAALAKLRASLRLDISKPSGDSGAKDSGDKVSKVVKQNERSTLPLSSQSNISSTSQPTHRTGPLCARNVARETAKLLESNKPNVTKQRLQRTSAQVVSHSNKPQVPHADLSRKINRKVVKASSSSSAGEVAGTIAAYPRPQSSRSSCESYEPFIIMISSGSEDSAEEKDLGVSSTFNTLAVSSGKSVPERYSQPKSRERDHQVASREKRDSRFEFSKGNPVSELRKTIAEIRERLRLRKQSSLREGQSSDKDQNMRNPKSRNQTVAPQKQNSTSSFAIPDEGDLTQNEVQGGMKRKIRPNTERNNDSEFFSKLANQKRLKVQQAETLLKLKEEKYSRLLKFVAAAKKEVDRALRELGSKTEDAKRAKEECTKQRLKMITTRRELSVALKRQEELKLQTKRPPTSKRRPKSLPIDPMTSSSSKDVPQKQQSPLAKVFHGVALQRRQRARERKRVKGGIARIVARRLQIIKLKQAKSQVEVMRRLIDGKTRQKQRMELVAQRQALGRRILEEKAAQHYADRFKANSEVLKRMRARLSYLVKSSSIWIPSESQISMDFVRPHLRHGSLKRTFSNCDEKENSSVCELPSNEGVQKSGDFQENPENLSSFAHDYDKPYDTLSNFKSWRLHPKFSKSLDSITYSHSLDPWAILCRFDLQGKCNDPICQFQHVSRNCRLSNRDLVHDLASYSPEPEAPKLRELIRKLNPTLDDARTVCTIVRDQCKQKRVSTVDMSVCQGREAALEARTKVLRRSNQMNDQHVPIYQQSSLRRNRNNLKRTSNKVTLGNDRRNHSTHREKREEKIRGPESSNLETPTAEDDVDYWALSAHPSENLTPMDLDADVSNVEKRSAGNLDNDTAEESDNSFEEEESDDEDHSEDEDEEETADLLNARDLCSFTVQEDYERALKIDPKDENLWVEYILHTIALEGVGGGRIPASAGTSGVTTRDSPVARVLHLLSRAIECIPGSEVLWCLYLEKYARSGASSADMRELLSHAVLYTHKHSDEQSEAGYNRLRLRTALWCLFMSTQLTYTARMKTASEAMAAIMPSPNGNFGSEFFSLLACMRAQGDIEAGFPEVAAQRIENVLLHNGDNPSIKVSLPTSVSLELWLCVLHLRGFQKLPHLYFGYRHLSLQTPPNPRDFRRIRELFCSLEWWSKLKERTDDNVKRTSRLRETCHKFLKVLMLNLNEGKAPRIAISLVLLHWAILEYDLPHGDLSQLEKALGKKTLKDLFSNLLDKRNWIPELFFDLRSTTALVSAVMNSMSTQERQDRLSSMVCEALSRKPPNWLYFRLAHHYAFTGCKGKALAILCLVSSVQKDCPKISKIEDPSTKALRVAHDEIRAKLGIQPDHSLRNQDEHNAHLWACYCLFEILMLDQNTIDLGTRDLTLFPRALKLMVERKDTGRYLFAYGYDVFALMAHTYLRLNILRSDIETESGLRELTKLVDTDLTIQARARSQLRRQHYVWSASVLRPGLDIFSGARRAKAWIRMNPLARILQRFDYRSSTSEIRLGTPIARHTCVALREYGEIAGGELRMGSIHQAAVEAFGNEPHLLMQWTYLELASGSLSSARRAVNYLVRKCPKDPVAWSILARLDEFDSNMDGAQRALLRGLESNPASLLLHTQLIKLEEKYARSGQADEAVAIAKTALGEDFASRATKAVLHTAASS